MENQNELKVVFAYPTDPYVEIIGGMTRYFRILLQEALRKSIRVKFVGVKIGSKKVTYPSDFKFFPIVKGTDKWWIYLMISFLRVPFMKLEDDEIIHSGRLIFLLPYILFHPKNIKILTSDQPRIVAFLRYPKLIYYILSGIYGPIEYYMIKRVKAVIAAPHILNNYWKKHYPGLKDTFREDIYASVGVDLDRFRILDGFKKKEINGVNSKTKILLFVGRMARVKGIDFLIDSFVEVCKMNSDSVFVIVGRGNEERKLKAYANNTSVCDKILFLGEKRGRELVEAYNNADVLLIGSLDEGGPAVTREALACGIPVVSTDVGDSRDILNDPHIGLVVRERNPKLFAKAISVITAYDREQVKKLCRERATNFSNERCFPPLFELYSRLRRIS